MAQGHCCKLKVTGLVAGLGRPAFGQGGRDRVSLAFVPMCVCVVDGATCNPAETVLVQWRRVRGHNHVGKDDNGKTDGGCPHCWCQGKRSRCAWSTEDGAGTAERLRPLWCLVCMRIISWPVQQIATRGNSRNTQLVHAYCT